MSKSIITVSILTASIAITACSRADSAPPASPAAIETAPPEPKTVQSQNPLFTKSDLQYEAPDFKAISVAHFRPAFEQGMEEQAAEIVAIAGQDEPPSFENTLVAMEQSGKLLRRTQDVFFNLTGTVSTPEIQAIEAEMAPKLSAHRDAIFLNAALFARIEQVHAGRDQLDPESKRLVEETHKDFIRAGAKLSEADKDKVKAINTELSELTTAFSQNLLEVTKARAVMVDSKGELAGLDESELAGLAAAADAAGQPGKYRIELQNTTRQPILAQLENRGLRERVWRASAERGVAENGPLIRRIVELRADKAALLGHANWASHVLDAQMAKTPEAVFKILKDLVPKVRAKVEAEAKDIQKEVRADGKTFQLEPWDWAYYAERVRTKKFAVDEKEVRAYFELDHVLKDGVFYTMNHLFGITFQERNDLPVYHSDVRTFEVFDDKGRSIGLFYADYFAREGKRGGAWMNELVGQSRLLGHRPVILNALNIPKPAPGEPALMSFDETQTMFHEMGHALHGLFSDATYPSLAGTAVPRDFVEFPSQFEEDWAIDPKVLANYAKHHETGEAMPKELLDKLLASRNFNQGFESLEYLGAALLDMEWHMLGPDDRAPEVLPFEAASLKKHDVAHPAVPPRYRSTYFAHVFAGGYSAGYYSYLWTEVLAADAFAHMQARGGLTRPNGDAFRQAILSRGNTIDPMQQYVSFRGQEPTVDALLRRRGLDD